MENNNQNFNWIGIDKQIAHTPTPKDPISFIKQEMIIGKHEPIKIEKETHVLSVKLSHSGVVIRDGNTEKTYDAAFIVKAVNAYDENQRKIAQLKAFINACLDCKSSDELHDFVVNNGEIALCEKGDK